MVISESAFIFISIFIVAIYALLIYSGYKHGFLYEIMDLLYTLFALLVAWFASPVLADLFSFIDISKISEEYRLLNQIFDLNKMINTLVYFIIIFLVMKVLYLFISNLSKGFNKLPMVGGINKIFGGLMGVLNATILVLMLSMLLATPLIKNGNEIREKTVLKYITGATDQVLNIVIDNLAETNFAGVQEDIDVDELREEFRKWLIDVGDLNEPVQ